MRVFVAKINTYDGRGVLHVENVIVEADDIVRALEQAERFATIYRASFPLIAPAVMSVEYDPDIEAFYRQSHPEAPDAS